jgi:hypothetical protein
MDEVKKFSLVKPTPDTPFHIDFDWWERQGRNWRVFVKDYLCKEHQQVFANAQDEIQIDWVDPVTAEVKVVDGIQQTLITHCALQPDFYSGKALVDAIFVAFLANGNQPLTPIELEHITGYPHLRILQTIGGLTVQKGIRPCT